MVTIANLDANNRLIGIKTVSEKKALADKSLIVPDAIDLPLNGTYEWNVDRGCFEPLGHNVPVQQKPPVTESLVLYRLWQTRKNQPPEVAAWMTWYENNQLDQHEKLAVFRMKNEAI